MSIGPLQALVDKLRQAGPGGASRLRDGELLSRWAKDRDEAAFELIVWRHGRLVLSVCRRLLRHAPDVEDAFQATFLVLVRKARSVARGQALAAWLHTVATRIALEARERSARHAARSVGGVEGLPDKGHPAQPDAELRAVLDEEVGRLSEKYRIVFVLCCLEGKTDEAAARELGCPLGTVLSRLSRARRRLRERLARRGVAPMAALPALLETAMPSGLGETTVQAAVALAAGSPVAPAAAALMEGAVHAMFMTKLKAATVAVMTFALIGVGGMAGYRGVSAQQGGDRVGSTVAAAGQGSDSQPGTSRRATSSKNLQVQLEQAKATLAQAQAAVVRLEKALKESQPTRGKVTETADPYSRARTLGEDVQKTKVAAAKAEYDGAVASLEETKARLVSTEKRKVATKEDLDVLKALVAKARADVDLKQAQLRLATLEAERARNITLKTGTTGGTPYGGATTPSLESRVKALEDQLKAMQKEMEKLRPRTGLDESSRDPRK